MNPEETIFSEGLPVNTLAVLERFKEIIKENNTNSLLSKPDDIRIRMIFWLLVEHISMYYWKNDRELGELLISFNTKEWDKLREHPDVQSMRVAKKLEG